MSKNHGLTIANPSQFQKGSKEGFMKKENKKIKEGNNKKEDNNSYWIAIGMCVGISIGTSIGASTNNMGLWLPIGLSIGLCIGLGLSSVKNKNEKKQELGNMFYCPSTGLEHMFFAPGQGIVSPSQFQKGSKDEENNYYNNNYSINFNNNISI